MKSKLSTSLLTVVSLMSLSACASKTVTPGVLAQPLAVPTVKSSPAGMLNNESMAADVTVPAAARQAVIDAYNARRSQQWDQVFALASQAQADPELGSYPMYWYLSKQLSTPNMPIPEAQIQVFLQSNKNAYLDNRLRSEWILAAAKQDDFAQVQRAGKIDTGNVQVNCAQLESDMVSGQRPSLAQALAVFKPGNACWAMLDTLRTQQSFAWDQMEPLLRDAIEYNSVSYARRYAAYLFTPQEMTQYDAIMRDPRTWLSMQTPSQDRAQQELVAIAFSRLARQDMNGGVAILDNQGANLLNAENRQWAYTQFGLVLALNLDYRADQMYRKAGRDFRLSEYNNAWRVRAAIRQGNTDWKWVEQTVRMMPASQQQETAWTYWLAQALRNQGNNTDANVLFNSIKDKGDFYAQLATEALGMRVSKPVEPAAISSAELTQVQSIPSLRRAMAMFRLGWHTEGVPEWGYGIKGLDERSLLAAAQWALNEQVYDRAINTASQAKNSFSLPLLYPAPFEGKVEQQAQSINLDAAWAYGLMRQESRFVTQARSSVGASGLMQLMPGTAQLVARKLGISYSNVNDFDTNTLLGMNYLKMTLDNLGGSEILATAGYNAGPNRAKRWQASVQGSMAGAIFTENIPFTETRLYVKNVLANATWYDVLFTGKSQLLSKRLGAIGSGL